MHCTSQSSRNKSATVHSLTKSAHIPETKFRMLLPCTGGLFGQSAQKSGGLFAPSSTSFGTPGAFGGGQSSAFPSTSTSLFGGTGGLFASPGTSNFALTPTQPQQAMPGSAPGESCR